MPSTKNRSVKIEDPKLWKELERRVNNSHILDTLVFPEGQDTSPYEIMKNAVEAMERTDIRREMIYAYIKTDRLISSKNNKYCTKEEKKEWMDAVEQYRRLLETGALLPSDSLVPFIKASKEVPNPRRSAKELELLFDIRNFHQTVIESARGPFINYHFPACVFSAYKKLLVEIQNKSGNFGEDGTKLMISVFNSSNPILQCSLARATKDKGVQDGIMHLFMGSVLCVRNVFAHKDVYLTNVDDALEYLSFASFLFKILDALEEPKDNKKANSPV